MANNPLDPLQALSAALTVPADSKEQAYLLAALRENLEASPSPIPILCTTLIKTVSNAGDSLLKKWVLDLLHYAICRSTLSIDTRTQRACFLSRPNHAEPRILTPVLFQWLRSPWMYWGDYSVTQIPLQSGSSYNVLRRYIPCCSVSCTRSFL